MYYIKGGSKEVADIVPAEPQEQFHEFSRCSTLQRVTISPRNLACSISLSSALRGTARDSQRSSRDHIATLNYIMWHTPLVCTTAESHPCDPYRIMLQVFRSAALTFSASDLCRTWLSHENCFCCTLALRACTSGCHSRYSLIKANQGPFLFSDIDCGTHRVFLCVKSQRSRQSLLKGMSCFCEEHQILTAPARPCSRLFASPIPKSWIVQQLSYEAAGVLQDSTFESSSINVV